MTQIKKIVRTLVGKGKLYPIVYNSATAFCCMCLGGREIAVQLSSGWRYAISSSGSWVKGRHADLNGAKWVWLYTQRKWTKATISKT